MFDILDKLKKVYNGIQDNLGALYEGEEQWNKLSLYKFAKNDLGMTPDEATAFAKKW